MIVRSNSSIIVGSFSDEVGTLLGRARPRTGWGIPSTIITISNSAGWASTIMAVGLFAFMIVRPYIADAEYKNGVKLEKTLLWDDAIKKYSLADRICRGNSDYAYAEGNIYYKRFNLTKNIGTQNHWAELAINSYNRAIENCPYIGDYHLSLGSIYEGSGDKESAKLSYLKSIDLDPNNAFYRRIYGNFCLKYGEDKEAIEQYRKSLRVYPNDFYNIIKECYIISNYDKKAFMGIAEGICLSDARFHESLGRFYKAKGWYDDSVNQYGKAIELAPDKVGIWDQLGKLLAYQGKHEEARDLWQRFIESNPSNAQAYGRLADTCVNLGELDKAIEYCLTAAKLDPNNSEYFVSAGDIYIQQGNFPEALKLLEKAKKQNPNLAGVHYRLGIYYEKQGEWGLAVSSFQHAIAYAPGNIAYRLYLAKGYYKREQIYEAIYELDQALKVDPKNIPVIMQLAGIYQSLHEFEKAKGHYQRVLRIKSNNAKATKALSLIDFKAQRNTK